MTSPTETVARLFNWLRGWRSDLDGWLVRARRANDPVRLPSEIGFVEEACIAVRSPAQALYLDRRAALKEQSHE